MKTLALSFALFISLISSAQTFTFQFKTNWLENKNKCVPCGYDSYTGEVITTITEQIAVRGDYEFDYVIDDVRYQTIELPSYYDKTVLPKEKDIEIRFGKSGIENYITAFYNPIINQSGKIELIKGIKVTVTATPKPNHFNREFEFASVSVLASGDWYKIGVNRTGVHKIHYSDLVDLGIGSVNPNHINIYGNHIAELPHNNSDYRPDDLVKNAIYIEGEGDNVFNESDYILFYANGPENPGASSSSFQPTLSKIDSLTYYFIHVDASDSPKRIAGSGDAAGSITHEISVYDTYALHEEENVNLMKSGNRWAGEYLNGASNTLNFVIDGENRVTTEPISIRTQYLASRKSGSATLLIRINGTFVDSMNVSALVGIYTAATNQWSDNELTTASEDLNVELTFEHSSPATEAWLDYMRFNFKKYLRMGSAPLSINHFASVGVGNIGRYTISNANSFTKVWEVTNPYEITRVNGSLSGSNYTFTRATDSLRTFFAFNETQVLTPVFSGDNLGKIANQNLHGLSQVDYLIITHPILKSQADRLAELHRQNGLTVHVVNIFDIYNEFGGGMADPVALRWFAKMFYDRAGVDPANELKYLCLFGDGSYDPLNRIKNNNYLLPTYNNNNPGSLQYTESFTADDFFGILDDGEAMSPYDMMDIGVGRIPVSDLGSAEQVVNKIQHYMNNGSKLFANSSGVQCDDSGFASTFGDWRNRIVLMADDEDHDDFVHDCESLADTAGRLNPEINVVKIYLDSYKQIVTSGGQRYPDVEEAINQNMNKGALVFNYVGHGGETGLSLERVVSIPMIQNWININNMPIFVSATCEFSRFDDPGRISAGETTLTTPLGGAVGMLTTTRLVSIGLNALLAQNLYSEMFQEENGEALALGEILKRTKNKTLGDNHMRHFSLLGDPALQLARPQPRIITETINGVDVGSGTDTLKALSKITIAGHVEANDGTVLTSYNGLLFPTVFDKSKIRSTLGQDPESSIVDFDTRENVVYKGKATVKDGRFEFSFIVPKDIDYSFGHGKISYYANNSVYDNYGYDTSFVIGGVDPNGISDDIGPEIELFMNDESFVNGGLTNTKPLFLANLRDENGINTTGNGIGHNITLILDGNTSEPIILNNFYEADLDTYQSGKVSYQLSDLEPGAHQITFKAWDVNNNSSEAVLDFVVVDEEEIGISHLLNYPNPFTTSTEFYFEHNQVCNNLNVRVEIFTVSGKLVKTLLTTVHSEGFRSEGIHWNGRDEFGDKLARGVYVYRLGIETPDGKKAEKIEKLVIL